MCINKMPQSYIISLITESQLIYDSDIACKGHYEESEYPDNIFRYECSFSLEV